MSYGMLGECFVECLVGVGSWNLSGKIQPMQELNTPINTWPWQEEEQVIFR